MIEIKNLKKITVNDVKKGNIYLISNDPEIKLNKHEVNFHVISKCIIDFNNGDYLFKDILYVNKGDEELIDRWSINKGEHLLYEIYEIKKDDYPEFFI